MKRTPPYTFVPELHLHATSSASSLVGPNESYDWSNHALTSLSPLSDIVAQATAFAQALTQKEFDSEVEKGTLMDVQLKLEISLEVERQRIQQTAGHARCQHGPRAPEARPRNIDALATDLTPRDCMRVSAAPRMAHGGNCPEPVDLARKFLAAHGNVMACTEQREGVMLDGNAACGWVSRPAKQGGHGPDYYSGGGLDHPPVARQRQWAFNGDAVVPSNWSVAPGHAPGYTACMAVGRNGADRQPHWGPPPGECRDDDEFDIDDEDLIRACEAAERMVERAGGPAREESLEGTFSMNHSRTLLCIIEYTSMQRFCRLQNLYPAVWALFLYSMLVKRRLLAHIMTSRYGRSAVPFKRRTQVAVIVLRWLGNLEIP
jgi:hypothetical protein